MRLQVRFYEADMGELFALIYDIDNIFAAWDEIAKGKRTKETFQKFSLYKEEIVINVHNDLIWKTYCPGRCHHFKVYEPKERDIAAPLLYDRLIHHALIRQVLPLFEKYFHDGSYACRKGKGTLAVCQQYSKMQRMAIGSWGLHYWYISLDLKGFFASINHGILKQLLARLIPDEDVFWLFSQIIDSFEPGLPLGFLPSQQEANLIGTYIDYFVTDILGHSIYVRYMDDVRICLGSRAEAEQALEAIDEMVYLKLGLRLSPKKTFIRQFRGKDTFCSYICCPHHLEPKKKTVKRNLRRISKKRELVDQDHMKISELQSSTQDFLAYMKWCSWTDGARKVVKASGLKIIRGRKGLVATLKPALSIIA